MATSDKMVPPARKSYVTRSERRKAVTYVYFRQTVRYKASGALLFSDLQALTTTLKGPPE